MHQLTTACSQSIINIILWESQLREQDMGLFPCCLLTDAQHQNSSFYDTVEFTSTQGIALELNPMAFKDRSELYFDLGSCRCELP